MTAHFDGVAGLDDVYWLDMATDMLSECDAAVLVPDRLDGPQLEGAGMRIYLLPQIADHGRRYASSGSIAEVAWCSAHGVPLLRPWEVAGFVDRWVAGT